MTTRRTASARWVVPLLAIAGCGGSGSERDSLMGQDAAPDASSDDAARSDGGVISAVIDAAPPAPDAAPPDADACAVASVARWTGTSHHRYEGSGGYDQTSAEVVWNRVASDGCVDRYLPAGTATWDWFGGLCQQLVLDPTMHAIVTGDGELVVDRRTTPASYTVDGETRWSATITCTIAGDPPVDEVTATEAGGVWVDASGTSSGGRIDGSFEEGNRSSTWSFGPG